MTVRLIGNADLGSVRPAAGVIRHSENGRKGIWAALFAFLARTSPISNFAIDPVWPALISRPPTGDGPLRTDMGSYSGAVQTPVARRLNIMHPKAFPRTVSRCALQGITDRPAAERRWCVWTVADPRKVEKTTKSLIGRPGCFQPLADQSPILPRRIICAYLSSTAELRSISPTIRRPADAGRRRDERNADAPA